MPCYVCCEWDATLPSIIHTGSFSTVDAVICLRMQSYSPPSFTMLAECMLHSTVYDMCFYQSTQLPMGLLRPKLDPRQGNVLGWIATWCTHSCHWDPPAPVAKPPPALSTPYLKLSRIAHSNWHLTYSNMSWVLLWWVHRTSGSRFLYDWTVKNSDEAIESVARWQGQNDAPVVMPKQEMGGNPPPPHSSIPPPAVPNPIVTPEQWHSWSFDAWIS